MNRLAYALFASVILLWGINWPIMKIGLAHMPPFAFGATRLFMGAALLLGLNAIRGELRLPARRDLPVVLSVGLLNFLMFMGCTNLGLQVVGAGRAALLAYTTPLWVTPGAIWWLGERPSPSKLVGLLLGLGGLTLLFNPFAFAWDEPRVLWGNGVLLGGAIFWALSILHVRAHRWTSTPLQLLPWQMLLAAPLFLVLSRILEADRPILWDAALGWVLAYNAVVATAFCFWASITVTRLLPATTTSLGHLGVPVVAIASSVLWVGEPLSVSLVGGLLGIACGLVLVVRADRRPV
jgi:drug/metabolite transporter (DMT)-like permease